MMAMLGGRLGAYRDGWAPGDPDPALIRNLYRGHAPEPAALAQYLSAVMQGLALQAGAGVARPDLARVVDTTLSIWPVAKPRASRPAAD